MTSFDPAAATSAYLAQLSPSLQMRASAYTAGSAWVEIWSTAIALIAYWLILRSGFLTKLQGRIQRRGTGSNKAAFLCGASFLALSFVIRLPWTAYADWLREVQYGLSTQGFGGWLAQALIQAIINSILGGLLVLCFYALIRRTGRAWWIFAAGLGGIAAFLLLVIEPVVLGPVFNRFTPAPAGEIRDAVTQLATRANIPADHIVVYDGSKQSSRFTAHVDGVGSFARIALSDEMFKRGADLGEVRAVVAHELGHYAHADQLRLCAVLMLLFGVALAAVHRLFVPVAEALFGKNPPMLAEPRGLPIIAGLFALCGLMLTPLINTTERQIEYSADQYGLDLAQDPDGAARALLASADYRASSPSPVQEFLFYDHPSISRRVRLAMDWKAHHQDKPAR